MAVVIRMANLFMPGLKVVGIDAAKTTQEPDDHENSQYRAKNAAEAGRTIAIITIVAAAPAEQHNQQATIRIVLITYIRL
jgi:hypothetical protein